MTTSDDFSERYYGSVHGGWVCLACGSLVQDYDVHDAWHEQLARG